MFGRHTEVSLWKQQYGSVYRVITLGKEYIIRPLTEREYETIWGGAISLDALDREFDSTIDTVRNCVLFPKETVSELDSDDYNTLPGGLADCLCDAILQVSDFSNTSGIDIILGESRIEIESTINVLKDYILAAEMGYSLDELENMTLDKICLLTAHAEQVTIFRHIQRQKAQYGESPQVIEFLSKQELLKRKLQREMDSLAPAVEALSQQGLQRR